MKKRVHTCTHVICKLVEKNYTKTSKISSNTKFLINLNNENNKFFQIQVHVLHVKINCKQSYQYYISNVLKYWKPQQPKKIC